MGNNGSTFLGVVAGTALGAVIGVLFAPDKGSETRRRIADEAISAKDRLSAEATLAKEKIAKSATDIKDKAVSMAYAKKQTLDEHVDSLVNDASHKTEDVITTLEKKLAELKTKNKKYQKTS